MPSLAWYTSEELEQLRRLQKPFTESGAGPAACEAAYKLKALAEISPEAAADAGLAFALDPAGEETDGVEHSRFAWRWGGRVFGLSVVADRVHAPGDNAEGSLSLYIDKDLKLRMDVFWSAADDYQQPQPHQATTFVSGDWTAQLWGFVETLASAGLDAFD